MNREFNKQTKKRLQKDYLIAVLIGLAIIFIIGANLFALSSNKSNSAIKTPTTSTAPKNYKYAYMAIKCQQGIDSYKKMRIAIAEENLKLSSQTKNNIESLSAQASEYDQSQEAAYKAAVLDFTHAYEQGLISYDELSRRIDALGAIPKNISASNGIALTESSKLLAETTRKVEANNKSVTQVDNNIVRLQACVSTANGAQDFDSTQVAELEQLIANSTRKPN